MRSYLIDELKKQDVKRLNRHLVSKGLAGSIDDVFWLEVPEEHLTDIQAKHRQQCGPYKMALILEETQVRLEFLVRATGKIRCDCIAYATPELQEHMLGRLDRILRELDIQA